MYKYQNNSGFYGNQSDNYNVNIHKEVQFSSSLLDFTAQYKS